MNEEIEKAFLSVLNKVSDFKQGERLTYPSADHYKENLARVMSIILRGEGGLCVYADYDCDGMISAIMLHRFLENAYKIIRGDDYVGMVKIKFSNRQNSFGLTEEEFKEYRETSDMVITVDNGSSIPFLDESLAGQLLVLDHHFADKTHSFVLNPNTGRRKGQSDYSTSGGRVVYDFIKNMDLALKHFSPEYQDIENHTQMETLRELASITLISDMALMDKENRDFVSETFDTIRANPNKLPIYSKLDKCNSKEFSFNIISQINAMSRMEQDLSIVASWVAPRDMEEWKKADAFIEANNTNKKKAVNTAFSYFLKKQSARKEERLIEFLELRDAPIGILGLLANRIAGKEGNKPTIVAGVKENGDISLSARGENVRDVLAGILQEGEFGGHANACGGKIIVKKGQSLDEAFAMFEEKIISYENANKDALSAIGKIEVINNDPLTIGEFHSLSELYVEKSKGVNFYKNVYATISDFKVVASHVFASGWVKVSLGDENKQAISFMFNGEEVSLENLGKEGMVAIMQFAPEDSFQIHSIVHRSELDNKVVQIKEAVELGVKVKERKAEVIEEIKVTKSVEVSKEEDQKIWYYQHPERACGWCMNRQLTEEENDGHIDEISKERYEEIKASGEWDVEDFPEWTKASTQSMGVFIPTEKRSVFLMEKYTKAIVEEHPDKIFVFGDNMIRKGKAGQAIIRDLPNAMGIPTKRLPSMGNDAFFSDQKDEQTVIINAINSIYKEMQKGKTVVFPKDGVGTGCAEMETRSPLLFQVLNQLVANNFTESYAQFNKKFASKKEGQKKQYNTQSQNR